jgi:hypothetical protein
MASKLLDALERNVALQGHARYLFEVDPVMFPNVPGRERSIPR